VKKARTGVGMSKEFMHVRTFAGSWLWKHADQAFQHARRGAVDSDRVFRPVKATAAQRLGRSLQRIVWYEWFCRL
jgi:hypothetical protein